MSIGKELPDPSRFEKEDILEGKPLLASLLQADFPLGETLQNEPSFVHARERGNPRTVTRTAWADSFLALYNRSIEKISQDYLAAFPGGIAFFPKSEVSVFTGRAEGNDYFTSANRKPGDTEAIVQLVFLLGYELQREDYSNLFLPDIVRMFAGRAGFKRRSQQAQDLLKEVLERGRSTWAQFHPVPSGVQRAFRTRYADPFQEFIGEDLEMKGI